MLPRDYLPSLKRETDYPCYFAQSDNIWTFLHFKARFVRNKFDKIKFEVIITRPTFICITETWLASKLESGPYSFLCYNSYHNYRNDKVSGSVVIYISEILNALHVTSEVTDCNSYNICAVLLGLALRKLLLVAVYRSPRASYEDTKMLCNHLDRLALRLERIVIMGDFNLPEKSGLSVVVYIPTRALSI